MLTIYLTENGDEKARPKRVSSQGKGAGTAQGRIEIAGSAMGEEVFLTGQPVPYAWDFLVEEPDKFYVAVPL